MCDIWKIKDKTEITAEHVSAWSQEWKELGVRVVVLTGGEALLHSNLWGLCEILRDAGISVCLLSTGLTMAKHASDIVRFLSGVYVSLDGPPEVHNLIRRVPKAFEFLSAGVRAVKACSSSFPIHARCVVQSANCGRLLDTVWTARDLGLNGISFVAADLETGGFSPIEGASEPQKAVALTREEVDRLDEQVCELERCSILQIERFVNETPDQLRRRVVEYYRARLRLTPYKGWKDCNAPSVSATLSYDGTVRPCFFLPPYPGNIHSAGSLTAIINSPEGIAHRKAMNVPDNPACWQCTCSVEIYRCDCSLSGKPPFCDGACRVSGFFSQSASAGATKG